MNIMSRFEESKIMSVLINILLISAFIYFGFVVYWILEPSNVIKELEGNYQLDKTVYTQGESFPIHLRICKNRQLREDIYGRFIDGVIFSIPENTSDFDKGCYDTYISSVSIPETLPDGKYYYEEKVVYQLNPIRTVEYTFKTPKFEVVGNDCN